MSSAPVNSMKKGEIDMVKTTKSISFILILVMIFSAFAIVPAGRDMNSVYAEDLNADGYDDGDEQAFRDICSIAGITLAASPSAWSRTDYYFITWNDKSPRRIKTINFNANHIYDKFIGRDMDFNCFGDLEELHFYNARVSSIDIEDLTKLTKLSCYGNQLQELDVSKLTKLTNLVCSGNQLQNLDVSNLTSLTALDCAYNQLSNIDVKNLTQLTSFRCTSNQLSNLDVSTLRSLTRLECEKNQLTSLDVSQLTSLIRLYCSDNQLSSLDISHLALLEQLNCDKNQLRSLDLVGLTSLSGLCCDYNQLTSLDLTGKIFDYNRLSPQSGGNKTVPYKGGGTYSMTIPNASVRAVSGATVSGNTVTLTNPDKGGEIICSYSTGGTDDDGNALYLDVTYTLTASTQKTDINSISATANLSAKTYNGKTQKPAVTVKNDTTTLKENTDYTVTYKNNKNPGKASIIITGIGHYSGTKTLNFNIKPKKTSITKVTAQKKKAKITWKKSTGTTGYQVVFSTKKNKSFKSAGLAKKLTLTKKKLKSGKTYYFKVRPYKTIDGKKVYGAYSKVKKVKIK